jgi:cardiolipin synthase A/B
LFSVGKNSQINKTLRKIFLFLANLLYICGTKLNFMYDGCIFSWPDKDFAVNKFFSYFCIKTNRLMSVTREMSDVKLYSSNMELYNSMIDDIRNARRSIHIEMYRMTRETVGQLFRDVLAEAAGRNVKVVLLIDAWGTGSSLSFFAPILKNGGHVRVFNTFRLGTRLFTQSHRRNHRKIMVIDDEICYLGSSNVSHYSLVWRELNLRMTGTLARPFRHIVDLDFKTFKKYIYTQKVFTRAIHFCGFEIIRDVPSIYKQKVMRKYLHLIKNAKESVYIETPYFLPGYRLRKAMGDAVHRGVSVNVVLPKHSDVGLVDVLRNRYLGQIYKSGINIFYYFPNNLHSKLMIVDQSVFTVGSTNFDYRSFRYMHEIILVGRNELIMTQLKQHKNETMQNVHNFDYEFWKRRPVFEKIVSWLLVPFRYLF